MADKFLILGAGSFYGTNFAECVLRHEDKVLAPGPYWRLGQVPPFLEDADYVVNFASKSLVAESWLTPQEWCDANLTQTTRLIEQVRHLKNVRKFIHVSTPESYGHTDGWVTEDYKDWKPSTPYGVSRAAADMMMMAYWRACRFPALITRTANIYGAGQGDNRLIPAAFKALRSSQHLPLHGGGKNTRRSWIHVKDACEGLYRIAKYGTAGDTYHISTQELFSVRDVCVMIARQLGMDADKVIGAQPERIGKDECYALDSSRLRNMGWRDTITLTTGLEMYGRGN